MRPTGAEDATAQHVRRALRALELLAEEPRTQADLARELTVHRRTARRLLARLVEEGYAESVAEGPHVAFQATSRLVVLGRRVADNLDLLAIARRHLAQLEGSPLLSSRFIAVLGESQVSFAHIEGSVDAGEASSPGVPLRIGPLHATAAGKVFLSADTALVDEILNRELVSYTERTIVTRGDLLLELATVRQRGFAIEDGEHRAGQRSVASGVVDHTGRLAATLGAVPAAADVSLEDAGALVHEAALACSREIGGAI